MPRLPVTVYNGSFLDVAADAIVTSTNPFLSLQAGTGGALRMAGGDGIQADCDLLVEEAHARTGRRYFPPGTAHVTGAGMLDHAAVIHCVVGDGYHHSTPEIVRECVTAALRQAGSRRFQDVVFPVLGTGDVRVPFDVAVAAMGDAISHAEPSSLNHVIVAVPDARNARRAGEVLSATLGEPVPVEATSHDELEPFVGELYFSVLHGGTGDRDATRRALPLADRLSLRRLLWRRNWRPRIVGGWLAGLRRERTLTPLLRRLLVESELGFAGQGYCFALARFGDAAAADALVHYLERWLPTTEQYEQGWAMAALRRVAPHRAIPYEEAFREWAERTRGEERSDLVGGMLDAAAGYDRDTGTTPS